MVNYKYKLNFSGSAEHAISELVEKYHLEIDANLSLEERLKRSDPEIIVFRAAEIIVEMRKGTGMKDVVELLKKDLKLDQMTADALASDIKNNVVPLSKIIEGEREELIPKPKTKTEKPMEKSGGIPFISAQNNTGTNPSTSLKAGAELSGNEVKEVKKEEKVEERKVKTVIPQEQEKKGPDDYREAID